MRAHTTVVEAFPKAALYANFDFGLCDQVQIYTGTSFAAYYLVGSNGEGALKAWFTLGGEIVDDQVILPGQGLLYKRSNLAPEGVDLVMSGKVRANPFFQRLDPGFNFISEPYPVTASFNTRDTFPNGFEPSFDLGLADQVQVFNGVSFTTYFLAGSQAQNGWFLTTDFTQIQNGAQVFDYKRSVFIKKQNFTTNYRVPLGWAP